MLGDACSAGSWPLPSKDSGELGQAADTQGGLCNAPEDKGWQWSGAGREDAGGWLGNREEENSLPRSGQLLCISDRRDLETDGNRHRPSTDSNFVSTPEKKMSFALSSDGRGGGKNSCRGHGAQAEPRAKGFGCTFPVDVFQPEMKRFMSLKRR